LAEVAGLPDYIKKVASSELSQDTDCPDIFGGFPKSLKENECLAAPIRL
jgi:hypothetical protein